MTEFQCLCCGETKHHSLGMVIEITAGEHVRLETFLCEDCFNKYKGMY